MLGRLTDKQIEARLILLEKQISRERDTKTLAMLSNLFQQLIDEQVRRDMEPRRPQA